MEILIIGCGVSGLSTGVRLLEAGHRVRIWAKALPPDTTSNAAAALWYPYRAYPEEKVSAWGAVAYREFQRLAAQVSESGVLMANVLDLKTVPVADPWWVGGVDGFRHATPDELPPGYADAYVLDAPVMDTSAYLTWLRGRFETLGGTIERREVRDLAAAFAAGPIVINCAGLGARDLVGDHDIHPARGQVVRVRHTGFRRVLLDDEGPSALAYIVPRVHDIVLGGIDEDDNESTAIEPAVRASILERCARLVAHYDPAFAASLRALHASLRAGETPGEGSAEIVSEGAGLRPVRSAIRLERERVAPDRWLIHNYGHGGAGVTLSWGCAAEVVGLVAEIV
ncbi:MAG TPA: FAD-dependent oxidoreductase [Ktedonobacterales bacterium]